MRSPNAHKPITELKNRTDVATPKLERQSVMARQSGLDLPSRPVYSIRPFYHAQGVSINLPKHRRCPLTHEPQNLQLSVLLFSSYNTESKLLSKAAQDLGWETFRCDDDSIPEWFQQWGRRQYATIRPLRCVTPKCQSG